MGALDVHRQTVFAGNFSQGLQQERTIKVLFVKSASNSVNNCGHEWPGWRGRVRQPGFNLAGANQDVDQRIGAACELFDLSAQLVKQRTCGLEIATLAEDKEFPRILVEMVVQLFGGSDHGETNSFIG
jgi:hypothetical protein